MTEQNARREAKNGVERNLLFRKRDLFQCIWSIFEKKTGNETNFHEVFDRKTGF